MRYFLLSLITLLAPVLLMAAPVVTPAATAENPVNVYRAQLAKARTSADSIPILYNLFDLAARKEQPALCKTLLEVAGRAHDYATENDMLRNLAVLYASNDERMQQLMARADKMPNSNDKHVTTLFIAHQLLAHQVQTWSEEQRKEKLVNLLNSIQNDRGEDIYSKIDRLYSVVILTGQATQGQIYLEALERLERLVGQLPPEAYPIRNQLYTALANIYTNTDRYDLAIKADRQMLKFIDEMEKNYHDSGRPHRAYAPTRYICYRRMLSNYRALDVAEVQDIYNKIQELAASNSDVASAEQKHLRAKVYYHMATKKYEEAIPLIQQMLQQKDLRLNYRRQALRELRVAAEKTGNDAVLLQALKEYTAIIDRYDSLRTADNLAELSVRYELTDLRSENARLQAESNKSEKRHMMHLRMYLAGIAFIVMVIGLSIYLRGRHKKRTRNQATKRD